MTLAELLESDQETKRAAPLRFATVGSVDDGKSTLIGRLLHDSKSIFEDQLEHIEAVSRKRGTDYVDLALLTDDLDISRGDMICRPHNQPTPAQDLDAMVAWMDSEHPLALRKIYTLKHTTRSVRAMVTDLRYRLDVSTLHREEGIGQLGLNEIGRVTLRATSPLFADDYRRNRITGSFVLIDEATNQTAAAGMLRTSG